MKAQDLYEKIVGYMSEGTLPSLPFICENAKKSREMAWFYYTMAEEGKDLCVSVTQVVTADKNLAPVMVDMNLVVRKEVGDFLKPQVTQEEYYEQVTALFDAYSEVLMKALLKSAEVEPLLEVYDRVADYLKTEIAQIEEDEAEKDQKAQDKKLIETADILEDILKKSGS